MRLLRKHVKLASIDKAGVATVISPINFESHSGTIFSCIDSRYASNGYGQISGYPIEAGLKINEIVTDLKLARCILAKI